MKTQGKGGSAPTNAVFILMASVAMCATAMQVLIGEVKDAFDLLSTQQGLTNSMVSLGSMLAIVAIPLLQGRVRKTLMMAVAGVLQVLMLVLTGASGTFYLLLAACLLLGVGSGWIDSYANSVIVDIHPGDSAKYMGTLHGFYAVGAIVTPLIIQGLLFVTGWRNVYFIIAGLGAVATVQFIWIIRTRREVFSHTTEAEDKLTASQLRALLKDKYNMLLVLGGLFYCASQTGMLAWLVRYMQECFDAGALGSLGVSIFWVCATISRFVAPRLRRIKPLPLVALGLGLSGLTHAVGILSGSAVVMLVMTGLNGLVSGQCLPMLISASLSRFAGKTSTPTSVLVFATRVGAMAMPIVVGAVFAFSVPGAMLLVAAASFVAMLLVLLAQRMGTHTPHSG